MKNNRRFKYIKLIASSLALITAVSACSKANKEDVTPQIVYVYVTATPTPFAENTVPTSTTTAGVPEYTTSTTAIITENTTQTTINTQNTQEESYDVDLNENISESTTATQPTAESTTQTTTESTAQSTTESTTESTAQSTTETTDDGWWSLDDEERQFWRNLNERQAEINNAIDNFSWAEARESAINQAKTLMDFIFYGGTMNGMTFEELTMVGRLEVYSRLQALDSRIMEFYPDYKTDLGELYNRVRSFASTTLHRAREIFSGRIDVDINIYPNEETTQSTMNANRVNKLVLEKK